MIADPVTGPWTIHGFAWISPALGSGANRIRVTGHGPILRAYVNGAPVATSTLDLTTVTNPPGTDFLRGRVGLFEVMPINEDLRSLIMRGGTGDEIAASATGMGMRRLREDGLQKVRAGLTSLAEVARVAGA